MRFTRSLAWLTLLPLVLLCACGTGDQDRPEIVSTWPAQGSVSDGAVPYIRVTYDEPVRFLNPNDVRVLLNGAFLSVTTIRYADEPRNIYIAINGRSGFPSLSTVSARIIEGLVVNADNHYALDEFAVGFSTGIEQSLLAGESGAVSLISRLTGGTLLTLPTPGGRDPVGVVSITRAGVRRIWVQLEDGGGTGEVLATFVPGDGAMTIVPLTTGGGDLSSGGPTLAVGPRGRELWAAFRDEATGRVRVHAVDTATLTEVATVELEGVPASASTTATGLDFQPGAAPTRLNISAEDGATGTLAIVEIDSFTEVDQDTGTAGIQGLTLPAGAGPTVTTSTRTVIANGAGSDATIVPLNSSVITESAGTVTGTTRAIIRSPNSFITLQGLTGFAGLEAMQLRRSATAYNIPEAVEVSDDVGGVSLGATDVQALTFLAAGDIFIVVLDTPTGPMLTEWDYNSSNGVVTQIDLDDVTPGVQGRLIAADPLVLGRNRGPFPD